MESPSQDRILGVDENEADKKTPLHKGHQQDSVVKDLSTIGYKDTEATTKNVVSESPQTQLMQTPGEFNQTGLLGKRANRGYNPKYSTLDFNSGVSEQKQSEDG